MREILFLLLFAGSNASQNVVQNIEKALSDIPTTLNKAELLANYEMIRAHEAGAENELKLNQQQQEVLQHLEAQAAELHRGEPQRSEGLHGTIEAINSHTPLGELLYQGDIVLDTEQARYIAAQEEKNEISRYKRQGVNFKEKPRFRWPNNTVTYSINFRTDRDAREVFKKALMQWQSQSCVNFVEDPGSKQRVELVQEGGCFSNVGYLGKVQKLSLGGGCDKIGIAAHELAHIMGMWHTHSRHDRDQYVLVDMNNIRRTYWHDFEKQTPETNENFDIPYDYGSIMHYSARWFVKDERNKTQYSIVPKDVRYIDTLGSHHISFYEILLLNKMYDCLDICKKVQRSPGQERVKRQMGMYFTGSSRSRSSRPSIYSGIAGNRGISNPTRGALGGSNGVRLRGEEGSNGGGSPPDMFGMRVGPLPGAEGSSETPAGIGGMRGVPLPGAGGSSRTPAGIMGIRVEPLPGAGGSSETPAGIGGIRGGQLPGAEGSSELPGEKGVSSGSTGGWKDWWNLPGKIGDMLPDWIWTIGAGWDWDHTATPPTTTTTTGRPTTTTRATSTTTRPTTTTSKPRGPTSTTTTTTTSAPVAPVPSGPSGPEGPPVYERGNCANGGFPNPRDCSKCICPRGYGGKLCNERPAGTGKILQAKTNFQTLEDTIGYKDVKSLYESKIDFLWAHYWIQAPQGRKIEVKVGNYSYKDEYNKDLNEDGGCLYAGVEIKTQRDQRASGYRYCFPSFAGQVFKSESNIVPIITYSRTFLTKATLQYRMI